jgi:transcription initiation factor TFIIH subunit 2
VFVRAFHDENPLSNLAVTVTKDAKADKISEMSRSASMHLAALQNCTEVSGQPSVLNALQLGIAMLKSVPQYGSREMIFLASSISSVDPGDVYLTLEEVRREKIRVSVVHVAALVEVHRRLAERTEGRFGVALSLGHLKQLLAEHLQPPVASTSAEPGLAQMCSFVRMGFPSQRLDQDQQSLALVAQPAFCSDVNDVRAAPFFCPRCKDAMSAVPATCRTCQLPSIAASHLARSYHHLFPVPAFVAVDAGNRFTRCSGCGDSEVQGALQCPKCAKAFCKVCDAAIHDSLFNCPTCDEI